MIVGQGAWDMGHGTWDMEVGAGLHLEMQDERSRWVYACGIYACEFPLPHTWSLQETEIGRKGEGKAEREEGCSSLNTNGGS